jgi:Ca-activated chloride channel homolog
MNETNLSPDDPRLTAYALGELEEPERSAVGAAIAADLALRAAVDGIRATAGQLETAFAAEPMPVPSAVVLPQPPRARVVRFPVAYYIIGGLAAAAFAVLMVHYEPPERINPQAAPRQYVEVPLAPAPDAASLAPETVALAEPGAVMVQVATAPAQPADKLESSARLIAANEAANKATGSLSVADAERRSAASPPGHSARGDLVTLNPFQVDAGKDTGNYAQNTLAGTRLNSNVGDVASSITVVTKQPLQAGGAPVRMQLAGQAMPSTETYGQRQDNAFIAVASEPLSTFSIDVDTAGYSNVRRFIQSGQLPPRDAVRIEELVNYFPYRYAPPTGNLPFAATMEVAAAPWEPKHRLVRIGLKGREVSQATRPAANLVFLLDVSGSMSAPNRLPLAKEAMRLLLGRLRDDDRVAIVTYAGKTGLELASTPVARSREILAVLDGLQAFGSTNGGMGIQLAYDIAKANFVPGGVNRVILCTDGDFNVGVTNQADLVRLIEEKAKSNVFLTVLGFGYGNLKDSTLELLANKGNGNYGYIDSRREAEKLLVEQVNGTLMTIAKDVKIQVEFNPAQASAYRLIGYENRLLKKEDFNNDKIDAGEIGAGHTVTALYEVIPAGTGEPLPVISVDELKYQNVAGPRPEAGGRKLEAGQRKADVSAELLTVKIRYKEPAGEESRKLEFPLTDRGADFAAATGDFKFAAAVAAFGLALREEPAKASLLADASRWAEAGLSDDPGGYRAEFTGILRQAQALVH